jgi:phosphopantothenoylcysteine synthetase/decarboxylase
MKKRGLANLTPEERQAVIQKAIEARKKNKSIRSGISSGKRLLTPIKAIREKCLHDCCCGSRAEVKLCSITDCALWPYRHGKRPRNLNEVDINEAEEIEIDDEETDDDDLDIEEDEIDDEETDSEEESEEDELEIMIDD